jgi:23S rRNA pseudouridine1911/1915/1917 synthase
MSDFVVSSDDDGKRLDKYLSDLETGHSRSYLKALISEGQVLVNQKLILKGSAIVHECDVVSLEIPAPEMPDIRPENIPLDILYEDSDVLIVNKPKDMVVHPAAGHYSGTLVNAVMYHCGKDLSGINGVMRPGIVHRIDNDTTGSVIICKNDKAHNSIALQLKEHSIKRIYHAIVYGIIEEDEGTIEGAIGRHKTDRLKMAIDNVNGKKAITHYKVLKRFPQDKMTYIACQLETGRTHQIRVHMAFKGHPLLGDDIYASGRKSHFKLKGQCLHAMILGFIHPSSGEYIETVAPLPEYFQHLLKILK